MTFERQISTQDLIHDFDFNQNSNYFISLQVNNDKKWHLQNLFREKDKIETTTLSNSESMYIIGHYLMYVLLLEKNFFTGFTAKYKHPESCSINDCNYYVEMKEIDENVILFNILFKNNNYIQIGLSEHSENVRNTITT